MQINIKNIGVVEDSSVDIGGLTVITGKNNSGKTTVGKILYAIFSAKENLYENATADIIRYVKRQTTVIIRDSRLAFFFRKPGIFNEDVAPHDNILLNAYHGNHPLLGSIDDANQYILSICATIQGLDFDEMSEKNGQDSNRGFKYSSKEEFDEGMLKIVAEFHILLEQVQKLSDFDFYETTKIHKILLKEFYGQIAPVKYPERNQSAILLKKANDHYCISIDNSLKIASAEGYLGFEDISNVVFIDDVTILDNVAPSFVKYYDQMKMSARCNESSDAIFIEEHKYSLIYKLSLGQDIVGSIIDGEVLAKINQKISSILQSDIVVKDGSFVCSSDNLNLANLALGSKMFAILKMLLANGRINSKTLLILDEPESHLHPMWQNKLAELVTILVKELNLKTVITSHSPNFVLALQTYAMKYDIVDTCKFYSTEKRQDGYTVDYKLMNEDLTMVYADFSKPLSEIKALFDVLKYGEDND